MVRRGEEEEDAKGKKGEEGNVLGKKRNRLVFFVPPPVR
jgi:hypothetical protein